ncbi:hypothetical protein JHK82_035688 [Glycine max]|nr:hypothetical protein JHK85_036414 [Glycine max]KAG4976348.1 hypothetical protein JHK86_035822 [Glycine max]KAG5112419.1 hypothetical protein JHK82_035688 [Glycine max]KAG5129696.1 hypothetical protein JHK84_036093 [Glycine max]
MRKFINYFLSSYQKVNIWKGKRLSSLRENLPAYSSFSVFLTEFNENLFEDGNHLYRFSDDDPTVAPLCYNIPRGIITVKPKPMTEVASRLRLLLYTMFEAYIALKIDVTLTIELCMEVKNLQDLIKMLIALKFALKWKVFDIKPFDVFPFGGDQPLNMLGFIHVLHPIIKNKWAKACVGTATIISQVQEAADCLGADCVPRYVEMKHMEDGL